MESNNDYRQLCKMPRSKYWHAAKHIFIPIHNFYFFYFSSSIPWPLLCFCGHHKICELHETMQTSAFRNAYEKCDWILFSFFFFVFFCSSSVGSVSMKREHNGIENYYYNGRVFVSVNLLYGANAKRNGFNFSEYV